MYQILLPLHSLVRWLVLMSLLFALFKSIYGYLGKKIFSETDNAIRHWSATIAHIQLMIGILLYTQSSFARTFWNRPKDSTPVFDLTFYGLIHALLMLSAIVTITIGSALAKRRSADQAKFKTIVLWYSISVAIIFIAIPWPFSPLSNRPFFRTF